MYYLFLSSSNPISVEFKHITYYTYINLSNGLKEINCCTKSTSQIGLTKAPVHCVDINLQDISLPSPASKIKTIELNNHVFLVRFTV